MPCSPLFFALALALALALAAWPTAANADLGDIRVTLEPGAAVLSQSFAEDAWGLLGAATVAVGVTEQLWLQVHIDQKSFSRHPPAFSATAVGGSLTYSLDVLNVSPFVEAGIARVVLAPERGPTFNPELVPMLGLGIDVLPFRWLLAGAVVRYYPVFETDLLGNPAYATLHLRLGVVVSLFGE